MRDALPYPEMAVVHQTFDTTRIDDIDQAVAAELDRIDIAGRLKPGFRVAVTAGSRGIANIAVITRTVVDALKTMNAIPFVFPAMGSHGGATAEGQIGVLAHLGITEETMGCPIVADMAVDEIAQTADGLPVFLDRQANAADAIVVINRIKPHTKFEGPIESGLLKMMAIGMGKHTGATLCHRASVNYGMGRVIDTVGRAVMARRAVLCGLGIVENGYDQTAIIRAILPEHLVEAESELLVEARRRMARIPFDDIDLLIVDEMGKNISGTGMDTNVTGVNRDILGSFSATPRTRRLFVRDLTAASEGNALGIGFADFTTTRLVEKIDLKKTYINCLTGISPEKGAIPIHFDSDRKCIDAAIGSLGMIEPHRIRLVHIQNTLSLASLHLSRANAQQISMTDALTQAGDWSPLAFGNDGNLISPFEHYNYEDRGGR